MTASSVDFKAKQLEFTRFIRNPEVNPMPADVKPERMAMYRELIFNNIDGFLASNFPVIRKLLDDRQWLALVQDFFSKHHCKTPYFSEIAEEFLDYLENERNEPDDYPFLLELAHYEWVEMALSIVKEDAEIVKFDADDLSNCKLKLSPLAWPLVYRFPVHLISPEFIPLEPSGQPVCFLVYRDRSDDVKFTEINALTYRMLEIMESQDGIATIDCLSQVADEFNHLNRDSVIAGGLQILEDLVEKEVVLICV